MGVQRCVCICVCSYTPPPAGLCDHIPADTSFSSPVASAGVSPRQALFVRVLIGWEETGADSRRRQEEPSHNNSPRPPTPLRVTQNVILPPAAALAQPSRWKEQTFKTLWQVSQALPLSQCRWWSWDWQAPSHRSWLGDTPSSVRVTSHPRQGRIPGTSRMMGWADLCSRLMWAEDEEGVWYQSILQGVSLFGFIWSVRRHGPSHGASLLLPQIYPVEGMVRPFVTACPAADLLFLHHISGLWEETGVPEEEPRSFCANPCVTY